VSRVLVLGRFRRICEVLFDGFIFGSCVFDLSALEQ